MRQNFSEGMEILHSDLNLSQARSEKTILDQYLKYILGNKADGFFGSSFKAKKTTDHQIELEAGLGIISTAGSDSESKLKAIYSPVITAHNLNVPVTGFMVRVVIKEKLEAILTEVRRYKPEFEDTIYTQEFDTVLDNRFEIDFIYGADNGTYANPATPAGFLSVALVRVTPAAITTITDTRKLLPYISSNGSSGTKYDAIVGTDEYCTHASLSEAIADEYQPKNILIATDINITANQTISRKINIESKSGCRIISNGVAKIIINTNGVSIIGCHFKDFGMTIDINATRKNNLVSQCRFENCTGDINDLGDNNVLNANIFEV